jgi:hypothetical protein
MPAIVGVGLARARPVLVLREVSDAVEAAITALLI